MHRRRLMGTALAAPLAAAGLSALPARAAEPNRAAGSPPPPRPAPGGLGANFNQDLESLDFRELQEARAEWVRGFLVMPQLDHGDPAQNPSVRTIVAASRRGYATTLSLKFPYYDEAFPAPGTPEMAIELARLDKVLPLLIGVVDILAIGNEPFIESREQDRGPQLNAFYEAIAQYVIDYRADHDRRPPRGRPRRTALYMGALNRLDLPGHRTPAVERWLTYVRETPELAGTDVHIHVPDIDASQTFLAYLLPRLRADQSFLVTEFSLVWYWQQHLSDPAPASFLQSYGFPSDWEVWQVIAAAIESPFAERQWREFLEACSWFEAQHLFLRDQVQIFRDTGRLGMASYGFRQDELMVQDFGPAKPPWLLNSVFATYTVQSRPNGTSGAGYWVDQFRSLRQHGAGVRRP